MPVFMLGANPVVFSLMRHRELKKEPSALWEAQVCSMLTEE
jgi:hypothetical protein